MKTSLTQVVIAALAVVAALSLSACNTPDRTAGSTGSTSSSTITTGPSGSGTGSTAGTSAGTTSSGSPSPFVIGGSIPSATSTTTTR